MARGPVGEGEQKAHTYVNGISRQSSRQIRFTTDELWGFGRIGEILEIFVQNPEFVLLCPQGIN